MGLAAGWLTAPRRGDWVRNQLSQRTGRWRRSAVRLLGKRGRDVRNRVRGGLTEIQHVWSRPDPYVDANTLVDQVHSQIGREMADLLPDVNLSAIGHTVYLHGHVPDAEARDRLVSAIGGIEGVADVDSAQLRVGEDAVADEAAGRAEDEAENKPRRTRRRAP